MAQIGRPPAESIRTGGPRSFEIVPLEKVSETSSNASIGDLNGDGRTDLAIANQNGNNVSVLLGYGDGTFAAAVNYAAGSTPVFVAIGDLMATASPTWR